MYSTYPRNCPICGSYSKSLLYKQVFADVAKVSFLKGYDVVVCDVCGFAFADNIPSQAAFDSYYERQSKYEKTSDKFSKTRLEIMRNDTKFINKFIKNNDSQILEIGCGAGDFLRYLKKNGFKNLTAIEPSQHCVNHLNEEFSINAIGGTVSKARADGTIDLIILLTVLEHIVDLNSMINDISHMLCGDGLLFIRVPNACSFADYDDSPFQQFSPEHINYFSTISAKNLLEKYGYKLLVVEEVAMPESDNTVLPMINLMCLKSDETYKYLAKKDPSVKIQLEKYIKFATNKEIGINGKINSFAVSQEPIVVWGIGTHTLRFLELGTLKKCNIVAFIDSNNHYKGGTFNNIPIQSPKDLHKYRNKILISSKVFQTEIARFIKNELKAPNELVLLY